jgi:hypothetical protein
MTQSARTVGDRFDLRTRRTQAGRYSRRGYCRLQPAHGCRRERYPCAAQSLTDRADLSMRHYPRLFLGIQEDPSHPRAYRFLAACCAHVGRLRKAREIAERLRTIVPVVVANASYLRNPEDREPYLPGLRLAAGEVACARPAALPRSPPPMGQATQCDAASTPAQPTCRSRRRSRTYPSQSDGC